MLRVYHSNQLDLLKSLLVHLIRLEPLASPLQAEQILVQSPGMAQWLKLELAREFGIAANLEFPLPASFIWSMFTQVLPGVPPQSAFNKETMTWKLMALLPPLLEQPEFVPLRQYLADDEEQRKCFQLSHKIADIFDQYLVYRPDWIADWEAGGATRAEAHPWQPLLWRALVAHTRELGQSGYHRANLFEGFTEALAGGAAATGLPKRIFVFGISALPPHYLQALAALGEQIEVHLMLTNPCRYYWGDIQDRRRQGLRPELLAQLAERQRAHWQRRGDSFAEAGSTPWLPGGGEALFDEQGLPAGGNSLLASMGKLGRDNLWLLAELAPQEVDAFVEIEPDSLLHTIQHDILEMRERTPVLDTAELLLHSRHKQPVAADDSSLVVHACHSPMREVEVLHDQLLALFEAGGGGDESLTPKDVVVMIPDINAYSPFIQAVFGSAEGARYIPYSISDRSARQENPILLSLLRLLQLPRARFSSSDIMAILEVPAVLARFGLEADDFESIRVWVEQAGIRWGVDEGDGEAFDLPKMPPNTWLFGLKRMLLGYAMGEQGLFEGILPYAEIEGLEADRLGRLAEFIDALEQSRRELTEARSAADWQLLTETLLARFYRVDADGEAVLETVRAATGRLLEQVEAARFGEALTPAVFFDYLSDLLTEQRASQKFLAGQVNFCTLMPMRSIPFKVVCLLGMNDGVYPRSLPPMGFDLMADAGRKGDRSRRDDDRYLFLEALLSARERLYLSYVGRSQQDNSDKVPSVLLSELLEYCTQGFVLAGDEALPAADSAGTLLARLVTEHPLTPYSRRYFEPGGLGSYAAEWLPALTGGAQPEPAGFDTPLPLPDELAGAWELELAELLRFYRQPCRYFFQRRLKVHFEREQLQLQDDEPFALDALQRYQLKQALLDTLLKERSPQALGEQLLASGQLPAHAFGALELARQSDQMEALAARVRPHLVNPEPDHEVRLQLGLPQGEVTLCGWLRGLHNGALVRYRPGSWQGATLLGAWLEHLCLNAGRPAPTVLVGADASWQLRPLASEAARAQLAQAIGLMRQGLQTPLPLFPKTAWSWLEAACNGEAQPSEDAKVQAKAAAKAQAAFVGGWLAGEGQDPYVNRVFPCWDEPLSTTLQGHARTLLLPLYQALEEISE